MNAAVTEGWWSGSLMPALTELAYLTAIVLFILALHWMNDPRSARRSVSARPLAMGLAIAATWLRPAVVTSVDRDRAAGRDRGRIPLSRVALAAVPQRTALSHAFGGLAARLVGTAKYYLWDRRGSRAADGAADGGHRAGDLAGVSA